MGTSLRCVQVYIGDRPKTEAHASLVTALRRHVLEGPYTETSQEGDQDPDREVFVGPPGASPWLTVFDTQGDLRELARELSLAVDGTAVYINLMDSDVLHLRRYSRGNVVDDYCNAPQLCDLYGAGPGEPAYWGEKDEEELKALTRGDLGAWRDLMVEGTDLDRLRQIWDSEPVFADDILWATADALAMNQDEIDADFLFGSQGFTRLAFRLREQPLYRLKAEGLPRLTLAAYTDLKEVYAGAQLALQLSIQNDGGAGVGLDIVAWGGAVEQGIVALDKAVVTGQAGLWAQARTAAAPAADRQELPFAPRQARLGDEERPILLASSATLALPQGTAGGLQAMAQPGVNPIKAYGALLGSQLLMQVLGSIEKPGAGELFIGFVPHGNRQEGQAAYHASLRALPMPRQPLRCPESQHGPFGPHLRALEVPRHLFAFVCMGAGHEQSAHAAADAAGAWMARAGRKKMGRMTAYLRTRVEGGPRKERIPVAEIGAGERWLQARMRLADWLDLSIQSEKACLFYDTVTLAFADSLKGPAPHLGLWLATEALDESELRATGDWLAGLVDGVMVGAAGLQAMVGRWDWGQSFYFATTPYEVACGIGGVHTATYSWCRKFLRGVTERLWLGPDLVARLGGTDGLAPIATATPVGEAVRVTLKEGATLDQLEQVLAPLLPSEQDWREGAARPNPRQ